MSRRQRMTEAMLDAAVELFGDRGYEKTSLADIAERVGLTPKAVYYYYDSKHELLEAVLTRAFRYFDAEKLEQAEDRWQDLSMRDALVESSFEAMTKLLDQGDLLRVSFSESIQGSRTNQKRHLKYQENWTAHVESIVGRHGELSSPDNREFAEHLVALIFGTCVDLILRPPRSAGTRRMSSRAYVESVVDHLLTGPVKRR